ncbi:hypothetical protein M0657_011842 [Pyricularia oryzae]|nr:hypothetical protein M9X92_011735 [Pyricularia oryzae]KAI7909421.1 hypothetical protein M0657_011842 [Pyricularia oryzae]
MRSPSDSLFFRWLVCTKRRLSLTCHAVRIPPLESELHSNPKLLVKMRYEGADSMPCTQCDVSPWADLLNRIRARKPCQRLPACRSKVSDRGFLTAAVLRVVELDASLQHNVEPHIPTNPGFGPHS